MPSDQAGGSADVFGPRTLQEIEAERTRLGPVLGILTGLVLVAGGVAGAGGSRSADEVTTAAAPADADAVPYLIEVALTPPPTPTPSPTPSPTPTARPRSSSSSSGGGSSSSGARSAVSKPAPTPTPKPGPFVTSNATCTSLRLKVTYEVNAREGTTISAFSIAVPGRTYSPPQAAGSSRHSGSFETQVPAGTHPVTVTATGSDGGRTTRSHSVTC
jgi:hypothetical protein